MLLGYVTTSIVGSNIFVACRLGHIGIKRMKKLHAGGLLESLDYESFDTCEPCLMGKMTKAGRNGSIIASIMHAN